MGRWKGCRLSASREDAARIGKRAELRATTSYRRLFDCHAILGARFALFVGCCLALAGCGEDAADDDGDFSPPHVVRTTPKDGETWAADAPLEIVFDEEVTRSSVVVGVFVIGTEGVVTYEPGGSKTAKWTPKSPLRTGAVYTLTIREVADLVGNRMTEVVSVNFTVK